MPDTVIPAGYRVTVVISPTPPSSNYTTKIFDGLTKEDAAYRLDLGLAMLHKKIGLEESYEPRDHELSRGYAKLLALFEKHKNVFDEEALNYYKTDPGSMLDTVASDLTGYPNRGYAMNGVESIDVQYVPETIVLKDVTSELRV